MKNTLTTIAFVFFAATLGAQEPSARTKAEQRLAELLAPGAKGTKETFTSNLPPRKPSRLLDSPEIPLKSSTLPPPATPKPDAKPVQPRATPEETPFVRVFDQPAPPAALAMPVAPLVRLWSPDVNEPMPLPILGTGVRDRASLADPSLEASVAAAQAPLQPARSTPVPFQAQNLPDPFEHAQAVRLRNPPEELPEPPLTIRPFSTVK